MYCNVIQTSPWKQTSNNRAATRAGSCSQWNATLFLVMGWASWHYITTLSPPWVTPLPFCRWWTRRVCIPALDGFDRIWSLCPARYTDHRCAFCRRYRQCARPLKRRPSSCEMDARCGAVFEPAKQRYGDKKEKSVSQKEKNKRREYLVACPQGERMRQYIEQTHIYRNISTYPKCTGSQINDASCFLGGLCEAESVLWSAFILQNNLSFELSAMAGRTCDWTAFRDFTHDYGWFTCPICLPIEGFFLGHLVLNHWSRAKK